MTEETAEPQVGELLPARWFPPEDAAPADPRAGRRAAIYARYSYLGKRESSIERQTEICTNYILSNDYILVGTYADRARTGTNIVGREELLQCLKDAENRRFNILVVEDMDRLGRALDVTVEIWKQLKRLGIDIHDSEVGKLSAGQIGAKAGASDEERAKIVKRNRLGKRRKARAGGWVGNVCFGYQRVLLDPKSSQTVIVKHPEEAPIVKEIFELYDKGVSCNRIAEILNARPADKRGNRFWTGAEILGSGKRGDGYLRRLRYAGYSVHGRNSYTKDAKGKVSRKPNARKDWAVGKLDESLIIVVHDLFDRVQQRLDRDKTGPRDPYWTAKDYPLGGLLVCASCGGKMTPTRHSRGQPRAGCNRARNPNNVRPGAARCNNKRSTPIHEIDDMVRELICSEISQPAAFEAFLDEYNAHREKLAKDDDEERPELRRKLERLTAERDDLWKARRSFGDEFVDERATELRVQIEETKARLKHLDSLPQENLQLSHEGLKTLASEIGAAFAPGFDAKSATGAAIVAALRDLIAKVVVDLSDETTSVEIHCNVAAVVGKRSVDGQVVKFNRSRPRTGDARLDWESRRIHMLVEAKTHALTDAEWAEIAPLVPDCVARSRRGTATVNPRAVIDAAMLHLREGVPLARMPAVLGNPRVVFEGLKRLSSTGAWDLVVDVLRRISPGQIPTKSSKMFCTIPGRYSAALKGLPEIRARHGVEMAAGKFAPSDYEWKLVADLVPEQVLRVQKQPARISAREFLHGILYMVKSGAPISHMPLRVGSETYFSQSIKRLVAQGCWDRMVERLMQLSPTTLEGADLSRIAIYPRSSKERSVWHHVVPKAAGIAGTPSHAPTEAEWDLIKHLFPVELLYVDDKLAVTTPRLLAHALLYRVKEKIPVAAFPGHFGDKHLLDLTIRKFVFHHLWEEMTKIVLEKSPDTLNNADMEVFSKYKRARTRRYAHLRPVMAPEIPPHAPSDAHWTLVEDLIPERLLMVRGKPPIMEPRKFLHAILYMVSERVKFGGLAKSYFGCMREVRVAMERLVRHHLWDTMVARFRHFDEEWAATLDLTLFDKFKRSKNENPEMRQHRVRRSDIARRPLGVDEAAAGEALEAGGRRLSWSDAA